MNKEVYKPVKVVVAPVIVRFLTPMVVYIAFVALIARAAVACG